MDGKAFWKKLLCPSGWLLAVLTAASTAGLLWVFTGDRTEHPLAYGLYGLSSYTLCVLCLYCVRVLPKQYRALRGKIDGTGLGHRYLTEPEFRARAGIYLSLGVNLLYVAMQLIQWYVFRSWWFVVLAGYYGILSLLRYLLAGYVRRNAIGHDPGREWRRARVCGWSLLLVNLSLSGAVLMILYQNRGFEYEGMLIYVMAMYTFYAVIHAVTEIAKYHGGDSPVVSVGKVVSLSAALVSLLNLETAMFSQFGGDMSQADQRLMIILTGAGISIAVVSLSMGTVIKSTKEIRSIASGKQRG